MSTHICEPELNHFIEVYKEIEEKERDMGLVIKADKTVYMKVLSSGD